MMFSSSIARICRKVAGSNFAVAKHSCASFSTFKYIATHEFIKIDGNIGTVGISQHAADALGEVVYVELPSVGAQFTAGDTFGSVESVKAASDCHCPVSGEVTEVNSALEKSPEMINDSPTEDGWFMKIKLDDAGMTEYNGLMDQAAYDKLIEDE